MDDFEIEALWVPAGAASGTVPEGRTFVSMAEGTAAFAEWHADGGYKRRRSYILPGDLWVWPAGQRWWNRLEAGKACVHLTFSSGWLERTLETAAELAPQVQLRDSLLTQTLRALARAGGELPPNPTTRLYQESLVSTLALHLLTHYGQAAVKDRLGRPLAPAQLRRVTDYVAEHLAETVTLSDLAGLVGLGVSQFSRRFRDTAGRTPHQFVTSLRVERARELLVSGRHTPAEVALLTGFADQSHLTRHVRRALGVTPGALVKPPVAATAGTFQDR